MPRFPTSGEANEVVTAKQMEIMAGQKTLLHELGKLERRQTDIAELQHQMVEEQSQRPAWPVMNLSLTQEADGRWHYTIYINNTGNKTAKDVQYHCCPNWTRPTADVG